MIEKVEGEPVLWQGQSSAIESRLPGASLGTEGVVAHLMIGAIKKRVQSKTVYAMTSTRALVLEQEGKTIRIIEHWPLMKATCSVINRLQGTRAISWNEMTGSGKRGIGVGEKVVGDVLFFNEGKLVLTFSQVEDPDEVIKLVDRIANSSQKGV